MNGLKKTHPSTYTLEERIEIEHKRLATYSRLYVAYNLDKPEEMKIFTDSRYTKLFIASKFLNEAKMFKSYDARPAIRRYKKLSGRFNIDSIADLHLNNNLNVDIVNTLFRRVA